MTLFTWSQTAADNDDADTSVNVREGWAPSIINNSIRALMAAVAKFRDDTSGNLVTAGTSTAYTLTTNQVFTSLADGLCVTCRIDEASGASPTLNVDSLGAKSIAGVYGTAIPTGYLRAGGVYSFVYDSTDDKWIVHGYAGHTIPLTGGGTGATTAAGARTALELGTMATQAASAVAITGGTIAGITSLAVSGNVTATGTITADGDVTAFSDARLKTDVETINGALDLVLRMRGVSYTRTGSGAHSVGVIAQEMQSVLPGVVHEGEFLSVAYGNLVGVLIEAVKELAGRIDVLEGKA